MDQPKAVLFMHASSLLHLVPTVPVHVTLCFADLHVPFGSDCHIQFVNIIEMRCCLTVLLATLTLGSTHLKLDHVGWMPQYMDDVASCTVSSLLSFACSPCSGNFGDLQVPHTAALQLRCGEPSSSHVVRRPRDSVCLCLELAPACACKMLRSFP